MTARSARLLGGAVLLVLASAVCARADVSLFGGYFDNVARAASNNDAAQVRQLVVGGNSPNESDATDRNHVEMAQLLLDVGAAVDPENKNGMTPLMIAASRGNMAIVQALLTKGANARKTDFTGRDALGWAAEGRRPAVVQALQRAQAKR